MRSKRILLLDNFDSFTYNLYDYFCRIGLDCTVWRNTRQPREAEKFEAIVLSPGPGRPVDAGFMMDFIAHFYEKKPLLGICLGHQALGQFFGAHLTHALKPMHGKVSEIHCRPDLLFAELNLVQEVVRYHSLVLKKLPATLQSLAETSEGENMAFKHKNLPIYGIQFHPEAILTKHGLQMLANWQKTW